MKFEDLRADMVAAMKAHEKARKEVISTLIGAIKKVAIDEGHREDISDELCNRVILKEIKTAQEQIDACPDSRPELKEEYTFKFNVMSEYAPKMMSEEEIRAALAEKFAEIIATKNKGQIMRAVMGEFKGKADGKLIGSIVDELCK